MVGSFDGLDREINPQPECGFYTVVWLFEYSRLPPVSDVFGFDFLLNASYRNHGTHAAFLLRIPYKI